MPTAFLIPQQGTIISSERPLPEGAGRSLYRLFRTFFWPQRVWFAAGTLMAVLSGAISIGYVAVLDFVGGRLEADIESRALGVTAPVGWIWLGVGAILALTAARALGLYAMTLFNNTGVQRALVGVQSVQYDALMDGDLSRVAGDATGAFVSRFINDVVAIREAALRFANNFPKSLVTVLGVFGWLLWKDWQLALVILLVYPLAIGPVVSLGNAVRKRSRRAQEQTGEITSLLTEGLQSVRVVKAYGLETWQKARARTGFAERSRLFLKVLSKRAGVDPVLEIFGGLALAALLGFVAWRIAYGESSLGDLLGFIAAIGVAAPEVRQLGNISAVAQEGAAAAERVFEIIENVDKVSDQPGAVQLDDITGEVTFHDVHFAYPDGTRALNGLSFSVRPGETLAIVGASGAGKSTIFNLLMRLYDPVSGQVMLDGQDIREVTAASLRAHMGLVAQDAALFDDTIEGNIGLGRIGATRDDIEAAARAAYAHDFISMMPGGYQAPAGEMGRSLSGGQRQRIALARAILRGAPILLLDEATSALDAESEARVQSALARFSEGRTVLIIAHRLSTVRAADRILVLQDGVAVEEGTHETLMARDGVYCRLARLQLS